MERVAWQSLSRGDLAAQVTHALGYQLANFFQ
jgi:hypothetical protein